MKPKKKHKKQKKGQECSLKCNSYSSARKVCFKCQNVIEPHLSKNSETTCVDTKTLNRNKEMHLKQRKNLRRIKSMESAQEPMYLFA